MKKLFHAITIVLTVCMLMTSVAASTESPTPSSPTPESPTPGSPTPGSPDPESPTPGSPTPGSPSPGTPDPGDLSDIVWERISDSSLSDSAREYSGLGSEWVATEILYAHYKDGTLTLPSDYNNTINNLNIADNAEIVVFHQVGNSWVQLSASLVGAGSVKLSIPQADGLGYFVIFAKETAEFTIVSNDTSKAVVDNENGLLIVKNFRDFKDKKSTQANFNNLFAVENATAKFSGDLVSTKSTVTYIEENGNTHKYTVIVMGDVNCDGKVTAQDYIAIRNHIMETKKVTDTYAQKAADVNENGKINAQDYVAIRNYIMSLD